LNTHLLSDNSVKYITRITYISQLRKVKVGQNIRKIRDLKVFSQEYLANKLGVSQTAIHNLKGDETKITIERLQKIADILEVTPKQIVGFSDAKVFNANFTDSSSNTGNVYAFINENFEKERQLYERLLAEKDHMIEDLKN